MLVRLAALAAIDAPAISWLANLDAAALTDITLEQVRGDVDSHRPRDRHAQGHLGLSEDLEAIEMA